MVGNPRLVTDAMTRINSTILGQFSHKKGGTVLMTATPQRSGDLTAVIREDPAWITRIYPLMGRMPDNRAAWNEYAAVLRAETIRCQNHAPWNFPYRISFLPEGSRPPEYLIHNH